MRGGAGGCKKILWLHKQDTHKTSTKKKIVFKKNLFKFFFIFFLYIFLQYSHPQNYFPVYAYQLTVICTAVELHCSFKTSCGGDLIAIHINLQEWKFSTTNLLICIFIQLVLHHHHFSSVSHSPIFSSSTYIITNTPPTRWVVRTALLYALEVMKTWINLHLFLKRAASKNMTQNQFQPQIHQQQC